MINDGNKVKDILVLFLLNYSKKLVFNMFEGFSNVWSSYLFSEIFYVDLSLQFVIYTESKQTIKKNYNFSK